MNTRVCVGTGDLYLLPSEEEVGNHKDLFQCIEDHKLSSAQLNHQLSKVTNDDQSKKKNRNQNMIQKTPITILDMFVEE